MSDTVAVTPPARFDGLALYAALDAQRTERGLSWSAAAREIWELSHELNAQRPASHPISPATLTGMRDNGRATCQHALFHLRWLGRIPEEFMDGELTVPGAPLPDAGPDRRLRWHLHARERRPQGGLYEAMDAARREQELTWPQLASRLAVTPHQLTGLRTARFAIGMRPAMSITQWMRRPATEFVYAARW